MQGSTVIKNNPFLQFLLYSNLFISLCAFSFTFLLKIFLPHKTNIVITFAFINFCGTYFLYNFQRIFLAFWNKQHDNPKKQWYRKKIFLLTALFILFASVLIFYFPFEILFQKKAIRLYSSFLVIGLLYFLPPFPLRKIPVLKPIFIALCWIGICLVAPMEIIGLANNLTQFNFFIIAGFLFIAALCFLFEIRDLQHDKKENVKTAAVLWGENSCRIIALVLFASSALLYFITSLINYYGIVGILLLSALISIKTNVSKREFWFVIVIDGLLILLPLIFILFRNN